MNCWPESKKKTVSFQGKDHERFKKAFEEAYQEKIAGNSEEAFISGEKRVFVVYGHDVSAREDLELFLRRLHLEPYIMQSNASASKVIIEVLEEEIPERSFGIVLLTPDDYGYPKSENDEKREPRARQNVILELGMLLGKLGRQKIAILVKGNVERPSDLGGVLYINYNDGIKDDGMKLISKLRESGIEISEQDVETALSSNK